MSEISTLLAEARHARTSDRSDLVLYMERERREQAGQATRESGRDAARYRHEYRTLNTAVTRDPDPL